MEHYQSDFERELCALLNRYSAENVSNTPDFILARYLEDCLVAFNRASLSRESWYGHLHQPADSVNIGLVRATRPDAGTEGH